MSEEMFREKLDYPKVLINQLERIGKASADYSVFSSAIVTLELFLNPYIKKEIGNISPEDKLKKLMRIMANNGLLLEVEYEEHI